MISIVITIYNKANYIQDCLESVLSQNVPMEIICIDDCSTDNVIQQLQPYADKISIYQNSENKGTIFTRILGLSKCTGEYMLFVDGDDMLVPGCLQKLLNFAEQNQADILEFGAIINSKIVTKTPQIIETNILESYRDRKISNFLARKLISRKVYFNALSKMNFDERSDYSDQIYFLYHFLQHTEKIVIVDEIGQIYHPNRGMTYYNSRLKHFQEYCGFYLVKQNLEQIYGPSDTLYYFWNYVCHQAIQVYIFLTEQEQQFYKPCLYKLMPEKDADNLIKNYKNIK